MGANLFKAFYGASFSLGGAEGFYKAAFSGVIMAAALLSITACASPSLKRDLDNRSLPGGALQVNFSNGVSP